jgi:hypothetical protein
LIGSIDNGLRERYTRKVYFKDLLQETDSSRQTTTDLEKGSSYYGRKESRVTRKLPPEDLLGKLGIRRQQKI